MMRAIFQWIFLISTGFIAFHEAFTQSANGMQALEQLKMFQNKMSDSNAPADGANKTPSAAADDKSASNQASSLLNNPLLPRTADTPSKNIVQPTPEYLAQQKLLQSQQQAPLQAPQLGTMNQAAANQTGEEEKLIEDLAYEQVEDQLFPMSEKEIKKLRSKFDNMELAKTEIPRPPTPVATSQFVNLSPGSTPPVIRLYQGFVTSLVFLDSTGAPWPIDAYDLGDPSTFNIQWDKTSNTLMIQATKLYNYGNMAVRLEGLNTPVMLTLIPGQKEVDYRVDMRIQGMGPNAQMPVFGDGLPPSANKVLLHVLDGVPPAGSTRLTVSGGDARAWLYKNKMYLRTNLTILSPAWLATMTSADGMHAYEMQKSPVILVTWHGKVMQLKVEGL